MRVPTKGIVRSPVLNLYFLADAESFASDGIQGIEHWTCESVDGEFENIRLRYGDRRGSSKPPVKTRRVLPDKFLPV